jgi:hypothetical protein
MCLWCLVLVVVNAHHVRHGLIMLQCEALMDYECLGCQRSVINSGCIDNSYICLAALLIEQCVVILKYRTLVFQPN